MSAPEVTVIEDIRPLIAFVAPLIGVIGIAWAGEKRKILRVTFTFLVATIQASVVLSMVPILLSGSIIEFQIWQIWSSNRIGSGLVGIGSILAVWLSMRIALNTRNNPETNLFTKLVSSAFGLVVLSFGWIQATTVANTWIAASRSLSELKASGAEISSTAEGYIAYVGTTEAVTTPVPLGIAFFVVSGIIILGQIWLPKQNKFLVL